MAENEPKLVKEWRELYDYVRSLGEQVLQIHTRLEKIDHNLEEISAAQQKYCGENRAVLQNIREHMLNKSEFANFLGRLNNSMSQTKPSLPLLSKEALGTIQSFKEAKEQSPPSPEPIKVEQTEVAPQGTKPLDKGAVKEEEKQKEERKKRRFPFLRWSG